MKTATISEAKNRLSALLNAVRNGESVIILDRKTPIARIDRITDVKEGGDSGRFAELERTGVLSVPNQPSPASLLETAPPRPRSGHSGLDALLEEREQGR